MKIRNRHNRAVDIAPTEGPEIHVEAGATVDVPDSLGRSLLEQPDNWEIPKTTAKADKEEVD